MFSQFKHWKPLWFLLLVVQCCFQMFVECVFREEQSMARQTVPLTLWELPRSTGRLFGSGFVVMRLVALAQQRHLVLDRVPSFPVLVLVRQSLPMPES